MLKFQLHYGVLILYLLVLILLMLFLQEVVNDVRYGIQLLLLLLDLLDSSGTEGSDFLLSEELFFCQEFFGLQVGRDATIELFLRLVY